MIDVAKKRWPAAVGLAVITATFFLCNSVAAAGIEIGVFKEEGKEWKKYGTLEIKGNLDLSKDGIVEGVTFRLYVQEKDKWLAIKKGEVVEGRLVITTDSGDIYTVWGWNFAQYVAKITAGRYLERK